ncbi:O-methyltransferase [Cyclobacterium xiamenense]|uniref:O-methyltransferase n=1 Tax=Cyclobacterium xiamenense TaxID=1297121 RepID=UPI0035CF978F
MIPEELWGYCVDHSSPEDDLLAHISRETHLKVLKPRMLSGPLQGKFLEMLVKMTGAKHLLEIGTFTGYATICMARGLPEGGTILTLDKNQELEKMVRGFFRQSGLEEKIDYRLGHALDLLSESTDRFDFVFIDADKQNYTHYYDRIVERLLPGGLLVADNVLWSGKVLAKNRKKLDKDTAAILAFNKKVKEDPRVENVVLPIRDGITLARKR